MTKFIAIALLAGFVGIGLTGCHDSKASGSKTVTATTHPDGSKSSETKVDEKKTDGKKTEETHTDVKKETPAKP